mmetsp:Transcript_18903/g.52046  ORF Transcript_18903/g.52046 Transcript_18903/m.52046 type:complete len:570 (+) Transcript_18903:64-1773(+)
MSRKVVAASGYFNPLHYGHVSYLQKAKDAGSSLVVIVNNDRQAQRKDTASGLFVTMPARERVKLIRSLACVDAAFEAVDEDESVTETLRLLHPDAFANGGGRHATEKEKAVCLELGIELIEGLGIQHLVLQPYTQHYDWGKPRQVSIVGKLSPNDACEDDSPGTKKYAELWMGDHPSGPSMVRQPNHLERKITLKDVLKRAPSVLGEKLATEAQLPFLLKVLSIHKALSIQAHPDRELARRLHKERPDVYKDPNHKPEIAIALTDDFRALCGFRPIPEIIHFLETVPALEALVGTGAKEELTAALGDRTREAAALKSAYTSMMHQPEEHAREQVRHLVETTRRAETHARVGEALDSVFESDDFSPPPRVVKLANGRAEDAEVFSLVCELHRQFGEDVGIFSVFFLNLVAMGVGECLYMPQNTPHAYLSGDIVECMACSDNVVRGGLTPKYKDIEVLCEMLNYAGGDVPCIKAENVEEGVKLYSDPSIEEFQVTHVHWKPGIKKRMCFSHNGPSLAFTCRGQGSVVICGEKEDLKPGVVFMLGAGVDADLSADTELDVFVACCPPHYFKH